MWENIKTIFGVTIVACLVWLYAESENVKTQHLEADVQFVAPRGHLLVIKPAQPQHVRMTLRCAAAKFAEADRLVRNGPIMLEVRDDSATSDLHSTPVVLKDRLAGSPLGAMGINITEVQPATIQVSVESLETISLPVDVTCEGVQMTWVVDPANANVPVKIPAHLAKTFADAKVEARLDPKVLAAMEPNVPHPLENVPLTLPERLRAAGGSCDVQRVNVVIKIRKQTETTTVPLVPVLILGPPTELARFSVVLNKDNLFLHDIALTGPSDAIAHIKAGDRITAYLSLTAEDLEKGVGKDSVTLTPVMMLPPGVTPVDPLPPLTCKITKVAAESPGAAPPIVPPVVPVTPR